MAGTIFLVQYLVHASQWTGLDLFAQLHSIHTDMGLRSGVHTILSWISTAILGFSRCQSKVAKTNQLYNYAFQEQPLLYFNHIVQRVRERRRTEFFFSVPRQTLDQKVHFAALFFMCL
jgi:hypothetical protein